MAGFDDTSPGFVVSVISSKPVPILASPQGPASPLGQVLDRMTDVTSRVEAFTFEDSEREADVLKLQVDNADFYFFEHPAWVKGNLVRFFFGYPGRIFGPRVHVIDSVRGALKLDVTCVEMSSLSNVARTRLHKNKRRIEIVIDMVREGSFPGVINYDVDASSLVAEPPRDWQQAGQTDLQFLQRLAEKPGYEAYVEGDTLHFHPRRLGVRQVRRLEYFYGEGDFLDFNVKEWRATDQVGEAAVASRDPVERADRSSTGSDATTKRDVLGDKNSRVIKANRAGSLHVEEAETKVAGKTVTTSPEPSQHSVSQEADSRYRLGEQAEIEMGVKIIGDPFMAAKQVIELAGISPQLSGKYYIERATHKISRSGYVTDLDVIRNALTQSPIPDAETLDPINAVSNEKTIPTDPRLSVVADPETGTLNQVRR